MPVLSNATTLIPAICSRKTPPLISTPFLAPVPSAATSVTGIEIITAHGEAATINTVARVIQVCHSACDSAGGSTATRIAARTTIGLYLDPNLSMNRWLVPFFSCASSTIWMIRATVLSANVLVARTLRAAGPLMLAAKTESPGSFITGWLSPVIGAWLTSVVPSTTSPSVAIAVPGLTMKRSPTTSSSTGISSVRSPR